MAQLEQPLTMCSILKEQALQDKQGRKLFGNNRSQAPAEGPCPPGSESQPGSAARHEQAEGDFEARCSASPNKSA